MYIYIYIYIYMYNILKHGNLDRYIQNLSIYSAVNRSLTLQDFNSNCCNQERQELK